VAPPLLVQSTYNSIAKQAGQRVTVTFDDPTTANNFILVVASTTGGSLPTLLAPDGFTRLRAVGINETGLTIWYRETAPATESISIINISGPRAMQVRAFEYSGARQSGAIDRLVVRTKSHENNRQVDTGYTGTTSQADQTVLAIVVNRYASVVQSGFLGGFSRLFESTTPQYWGRDGSNWDGDRNRLSVHQLVTSVVGTFRLLARISSSREFITAILTIKGGSSGPARFASTTAPPLLSVNPTEGSQAMLSAFGKLRSEALATPLYIGRGGAATVMLPFEYQFRMNGLLVGDSTPYDVTSHDGLYGYTVRTSDDEQPRGDGSLRGVDLQSARLIMMRLEVGGSEQEVEQLLGVLYKALTPRRDLDWEFVWRHPAQPAKMLRCRPIELPRELSHNTTRLAGQAVALRAADPRHYSAVLRRVTIPNTPAGSAPVTVTVNNAGDIPAHPKITIAVPTTGQTLSRVELVNESGLITFHVQMAMPPGATLVGDMEARVTGAPRSTITLDGQSKYGSWQLPRAPFRIDPDPYAIDGDNVIYLRTEPAGAPVTCTLEYRDTWAG
jgi:hypothetical protein